MQARLQLGIPAQRGVQQHLPLLTYPLLSKVPEHRCHRPHNLSTSGKALSYGLLGKLYSGLTGRRSRRYLHVITHLAHSSPLASADSTDK